MAEVRAAESDLLHQKWGPMPVWAWSLIGLGVAWLWAKYRSNQAAASTSTTTAAGTNASEPQQVAPQFILEEGGTSTTVNVPPDQEPIPAPTAPPPPVTTPPGTGPSVPIRSGGNPPRRPTPTPAPRPPAKKPMPQPTVYRVQHGDNLASIASKFGVPGGWATLWHYNTTPGVRPASTIATLKRRGPNLIYAGEEILIPPK